MDDATLRLLEQIERLSSELGLLRDFVKTLLEREDENMMRIQSLEARMNYRQDASVEQFLSIAKSIKGVEKSQYYPVIRLLDS